jgi:hypothetical protein
VRLRNRSGLIMVARRDHPTGARATNPVKSQFSAVFRTDRCISGD